MFKLLQSLFGKKSVEVKQPEFHEEIRAQVEAGAVKVEVKETAEVKADKKPAAKKAGAKKAPAKSADKKPAKKPAKSKKQ